MKKKLRQEAKGGVRGGDSIEWGWVELDAGARCVASSKTLGWPI